MKGRAKKLYPSLPGSMLGPMTVLASGVSLSDSQVTSNIIADSAVTFAKIQTINAQRLLGRYDSNAGVVQEIALGTGLAFDSTTGVLNSTGDTSHDDCSIETAQIGDSAIITEKLKDSSVTSAKIADSAVVTAKISDSQVTYAKIQGVTAQRLLGRSDNAAGVTQEIALSAELRFDSDNDWLEITDCGVETAQIGDSAVTTAKILDSNVTTAKINDAAITASKLYDTTIPTRVLDFYVTDTTLTVGDTFATFFIPAELNGYDIVRAEMAAKVSSTTGNPTIQLRNVTLGVDILSTKITMDTGEKTSYTAATPSVINTSNDSMATGNEIAIDVDSAGTCEDVHVILSFKKP